MMKQKNEEAVKGFLDTKDPEAIKAVMKNPKVFIKVYNSYCRKCQLLVKKDSTRPFTDYCKFCQAKAERSLHNKGVI